MRYAEVIPFDVCNGKQCGTSLFVQGCRLKCAGCFNPEAWDFDKGKDWDNKVKDRFLEVVARPYIKRVSILGGEPLEPENIDDVYEIIKEIKKKFSNKMIWLYTGKKAESLTDEEKKVVEQCDILVDGAYVETLKDVTLAFRGSTNQRIIDVQESLKQNEIVLYN